MYKWLQAYIKQKANTEQQKVDDFGIGIPMRLVLKVDKVEMLPIEYEKKEENDGDVSKVEIPELCKQCYHLDDVNQICKANMSFDEVVANEECALFYNRDRVGNMGFSASEQDKEQIKQINSINYDEMQQKLIEEIIQIGEKGKQCKHRDKNRTFLKSPLKSYKYSSQSCIEHFLTCERDYLKKKTTIKKGEKEQEVLFEAAKKLCSFIRRRRFGNEDASGYIIKKAEVNKYDGTVEVTDAVDLFLASVIKTFKKLPKDLLVKWSEWCSHYRIDTKIEDAGLSDIKKRVRNNIYKDENAISHTATTAWKIAKDKYKMNEDEVQRRINEIHKYERVVKRTLSQQEAERMFKRMFDGKVWEDVKAPINFKLL